MPTIRFDTTLFNIGSTTILLFPKAASAKLPSRGMAMVEGTLNGVDVVLPLEPDGKGSHWYNVPKKLKLSAGDKVTLAVEPMKEWKDPAVPADWKAALAKNPKILELWMEITPMARWDWIRWIGMSKNPDTRKKHIEVALSKMKGGERRPCCFNRSMCTDPSVSKTGKLIEAN